MKTDLKKTAADIITELQKDKRVFDVFLSMAFLFLLSLAGNVVLGAKVYREHQRKVQAQEAFSFSKNPFSSDKRY